MEIMEIGYQYGCTDSNVSLKWTPPIGNHRIDFYLLSFGGQLHAIVNSTSGQIAAVPYGENVTAQVAAVNCAGIGVAANFTTAIGTCMRVHFESCIYDIVHVAKILTK